PKVVPAAIETPAPPPAPAPAPVAAPKPEPAVAGVPGNLPPRTRPKFKEGGKATPHWSKDAEAAGGVCVVRLRIAPNGKLQKITFLECPEVLQDAVNTAAAKSKYLPATEGDYPVAGAFRATWDVGASE
ncbi:MAG: hypothetical protein ABMB14_33355, partial [Myxococcota bacterium]